MELKKWTSFITEANSTPIDKNVIEKRMNKLVSLFQTKDYSRSGMEYELDFKDGKGHLALQFTLSDRLYSYYVDFSKLEVKKAIISYTGAGKPEDKHKIEKRRCKDVPISVGIGQIMKYLEKEVKSLMNINIKKD